MSSEGTPVGRNAPCHCGSGKRFKDCHGALAPGRGASREAGAEPPAEPRSHSREPLAQALALDRQLIRRGLDRMGLDRPDLAREAFDRVLALDDRHPDALHQLARLDFAAGHRERALARVDAAIASYPAHAPFHVSRARILLALGRRADASEALRTAAAADVDAPEHWRIEGDALLPAPSGNRDSRHSSGAGPASAPLDDDARERALDATLIHARSLRGSGERADAERCLRDALARFGRSPPLFAELASLLLDTVRHEEAAEVLGELVALQGDDDPHAVALLARALTEIGRADDALRLLRDARSRHPANLEVALPAALALKPVYDDAADLARVRERYVAGLAQLQASAPAFGALAPAATLRGLAWSNFYLAYHGEDDRPLQERYADFAGGLLDRAVPRLREPLPPPDASGRRIRIGFASHYFYECTVGRYFSTWVTGLDRDRFETFVYHLRAGRDAVSERLAASADHFVHAGSGAFAGDRIRSDALDILVYPELGGNGSTFLLAALRLAPVQCCGWGHPVTTGHATIDAFFSSDLAEPPDGQDHYRERLIRLPGIGVDYAPPAATVPHDSVRARESLGLPADRRLYLFPQSIYKIHPDNDALLGDVLAQDPKSRLLLFRGHTEGTTERFLRRLDRTLRRVGVDTHDRVVVLPLVSHDTYLRLNAACDVMLDSLHWSGGNTSLDAIAAGLPVVSLPGRFMRGRQTLAMLRALDLTELAASDADEYTELAIRIANDAALRSGFVERMRERRDRVFHDTRAVPAMERFYRNAAGGA